MSSIDDRADEIGMRAAEWVARLDGSPLSEEEQRALRSWLEEAPDHRAAFEEAGATWRELSLLRHDPGPLRGLSRTRRKSSVAQRAVRIGALLGLLALGAGIARYQFGDLWLLATADYRTSPGELRTVTLTDGSSVELGPASAIVVDFDDKERRVKFLAGEVFFSAMPRTDREPRPFVVEAAGGTTTALGTQFVIEEAGSGADVLAIEHQVNVALQRNGERQGVVLSPGEEVRYTPERGMGRVRSRDVETATAWRRGMLVFNGTPLRHVVETLNRYRRGRIVILDETLARRRVSGVFATDDLGDAIETMTAELGISARSIYPLITVLY
ncbi:FecR domain-containing protein [Ancylobacter sp. MQZ15Z-1]|uniref:FecR domain-containing protein n=1 Tax=Ancylobacter mangrovi TaxID=2972472 RepID=A0A9X2PI43_9HYPH|nr:FecR domain-containing protein [Ancylobacter mangrovi]MCS0496530.1 FecR domain-containing protein [Ancylobacter mangrovi]